MRTETRIVRGEVRAVGAAGKAMRVSGIAARYNNPTVIKLARSSFKEILLTGAFRKVVAAKHDTAFLINHDANKLMGRVSSGTLRLRDTSEGLEFDVDFPDTEEARSAYASIQRGDMHGCSFQFATETGDDEWSLDRAAADGKAVAVRKIRNVATLDDVSAVTFPAYPNTSVSARSQEFENRSAIKIPAGLVEELLEEVSDEDAADVVRRRRELFGIVLS
jgi:HK97 family phage prohead protease